MISEPEMVLPCVEVEPENTACRSVIWLHGLGADGHDFEGLVPQLSLPAALAIRFVFPHAPRRAVTVNNGMVMPAWYDIRAMDLRAGQDAEGIAQSAAQVMALVRREQSRGIPYEQIVLAGFSQGGAIALHTGLRCEHAIAGIMALSTYLPLSDSLAEERNPANTQIPIFTGHGTKDPVVPIAVAEQSVEKLTELGYTTAIHRYDMEHSVCMNEVRDIREWLLQIYRTENSG